MPRGLRNALVVTLCTIFVLIGVLLVVWLQGLERYKVGERNDYYSEECYSYAE